MKNVNRLASSLLAAIGSMSDGGGVARRERVARVASIAAGFAALAGGEENAVALVESLHEGVAVPLTYPAAHPGDAPRMVVIDVPTAPMDWHDVRMSLILARNALMGVGVLRPSGEQLHAALMGAEVAVPGGRRVSFQGVLSMRAGGLHWGRIASEGFQRTEVSRID